MLSEVEYDPVRHLSDALFPFDQKERVMVMFMGYTAYFDESENTPNKNKPNQRRVYTIAGCISIDRQWVKFQKKWKAILDKEVRPSWEAVYGKGKPVFFHMTDFANPYDKVYGKWSEEKKRTFLGELHAIMAAHTLRRFATGVLVDDYDKLTDEEKFVVGHPHVCATINCLKRIRQWANAENYREPMLCVFEKGSVHDTKIQWLIEKALDDDMKAEYRVGGLAFKDKREFSPLQSADIIATETRWEVCRQYDPAVTRKQRGSIVNLHVKNLDEWYIMDAGTLRQ